MSFMWKNDLKNLKDRRKETGGSERQQHSLCAKAWDWHNDPQPCKQKHLSLPGYRQPSLRPSPRPSLSCTNTPCKSPWFENPPSSQLQLLAHWGPQPGCGRACCPAPQSPSPPRRQRSGKRRQERDHLQAARWNSTGLHLDGSRYNFNVSVLPTHRKGHCAQAVVSLMGRALSK